MKRANDQLHVDNNAPANTMDAFLHPQKRVRHTNALCLTLSCDIDSLQSAFGGREDTFAAGGDSWQV